MRERDDDLARLQAILDRSRDAGGKHLRSVFDDEHELTAEQLIAALDGIFEMHLAVVTADGAPLVAPVDGICFRGAIWFGVPAAAVRARLLKRDPRVSASYSNGSFAFIVHGRVHAVDETDSTWVEYESLLRDLYVAQYGPGWIGWYESLRRQPRGASFTGYIEPRVLFAKL